MKKGANVKVTAKECRGDVNRMIKKFIKKVKKEKIIEQVRERRHYKKRSELKKEKIRRGRNRKNK